MESAPDILPAARPRHRLLDGWSVAAGLPLLAAAGLHVASLFLVQAAHYGRMASSGQLVVAQAVPAAGWLLAALLAVPDRSRPAAAAVATGLALGEVGLVVSSVAGLGVTPGPGLWTLAAAWVAGAVGAGVAAFGSPVWLGRPVRRPPPAPLGGLTAVAALVMGVALLPPWDRYVAYVHAYGASRVYFEGSAFARSNPAGAVAGDLLAAVLWAAVPIAAALWRPGRIGALLSAGVLVAVAGQVASAVVGFDAPGAVFAVASPTQILRLGIVLEGSSLTGWYDAEIIAALALAALLALRWWTPDPPAPAGGAPLLWSPPPAEAVLPDERSVWAPPERRP